MPVITLPTFCKLIDRIARSISERPVTDDQDVLPVPPYALHLPFAHRPKSIVVGMSSSTCGCQRVSSSIESVAVPRVFAIRSTPRGFLRLEVRLDPVHPVEFVDVRCDLRPVPPVPPADLATCLELLIPVSTGSVAHN